MTRSISFPIAAAEVVQFGSLRAAFGAIEKLAASIESHEQLDDILVAACARIVLVVPSVDMVSVTEMTGEFRAPPPVVMQRRSLSIMPSTARGRARAYMRPPPACGWMSMLGKRESGGRYSPTPQQRRQWKGLCPYP